MEQFGHCPKVSRDIKLINQTFPTTTTTTTAAVSTVQYHGAVWALSQDKQGSKINQYQFLFQSINQFNLILLSSQHRRIIQSREENLA